MVSIAEVVERIRATPAPMLIVDSCNFLNLFEAEKGKLITFGVEEVKAASRILHLLSGDGTELHLVVPELVPWEFQENTDEVLKRLLGWVRDYDDAQTQLATVCRAVGLQPPICASAQQLRLDDKLKSLAEDLLGKAAVLPRDPGCLERAVNRVVERKLPSTNKNQQLKDSMNLEQALELCRLLGVGAPFGHPKCFISSDVSGYGVEKKDHVHEDLEPEFAAVGLKYFKSFQAVRGFLMSEGYPNFRG